ncbi:MAG: glycosyltransferase family 39 protein [Cytophagales bacterium]|nr:MAG: glycosyltransferase family 39 protein [Cytophagales bacterium]
MQKILSNRLFIGFLLFFGCVNLFLNNGFISLWDQDEAAYAGFASVMRSTGNWVIPDFLWSDIHRKTPLHFWLIALSYGIFGENEFALRFPSALAVLLTWVSTFYLGRSVFGKERALLATLLVVASIFLVNLGKIAVTDALLTFFETVAVLALLNFLVHYRWYYNLLFWAAVSAGMLVKGPPILIVSAGTGGLLLLFHSSRWRLLMLHPWFFFPLALLPLWLWGRAAWLADNGVFITWLYDWYIAKRASGETVLGQWGPPGYFLLVFMLSFLPFTVFFPAALREIVRQIRGKLHNEQYLLLICWLAGGWWIYEIIPSKLPSYSLGAYAAVAFLLADIMLRIETEDFGTLRIGKGLFLFFSSLIALGLVIGSVLLLDTWGIAVASFTALVWSVLAGFSYRAYHQKNWEAGFRWGSLQVLVFVFLAWLLIIPSFEEPRGATKRIAEKIAQTSPNTVEVVFARPFYLPSLPFYVLQSGRKYRGLEEQEFEQVFGLYAQKKPTVIVFDKEKCDLFVARLDSQKQKMPRVEIIRGWVSDMGKLIEYKLVYNF